MREAIKASGIDMDRMDGDLHSAPARYMSGRGTFCRIHGTTEPWSIGNAVSSGCIRILNRGVIDLYNRVPKGAKVVVM
jgi:lipoprotein-anchoring transpeptidase ErfK/SrfK